jgi:alpha-L-arabinofuranosidase
MSVSGVAVTVVFDRLVPVAEIDRRVFGSFAEHMGRSIYQGIYEPGSPYADQQGLRTDVLDLVRELGVTVVRYPGGNFLSGYDWKDGIGPREARRARLDLAWHSLETNKFGVDEFMAWCATAGVEPMMAANLGTGTLSSAIELLEYCTVDAASAYATLRAVNGHPEPYRVRTWCLGNEMDGPWQIGHQSADEYGRKAAEVARAMRMIDPALELVACGSSNRTMPTFGAWEQTVLEHTYDQVDFISLHQYYDPGGHPSAGSAGGSTDDVADDVTDDVTDFLGSGAHLEAFITEVTAVADAVKARRRSTKTLNLSLDEWNVWRQRDHDARLTPTTWDEAPRLIEDTYTVADAVVVGDLLISILRHADRVRMACLAQLVNVIAPIRAEPDGPAWRQTIFHPFALTARHALGAALLTTVHAPDLATGRHGDVPQVSAVATFDEPSGLGAVFLVNRGIDEPARVNLNVRGFAADTRVLEHLAVFDHDLDAVNVQHDPDRVVPRALNEAATGSSDLLQVTLPPVSWNLVRFGTHRPKQAAGRGDGDATH